MKHDGDVREDSGMTGELRSALTGGDPTNTARLHTVAHLCAGAALRVAVTLLPARSASKPASCAAACIRSSGGTQP
jgi:hypothetical protein